MKVFVTGGSGFVGSCLIKMLIQQGYEVIALARSAKAKSSILALGASAIEGDILNEEALKIGMQNCAVVYHAAGYLGTWGSYREFYAVNVEGTEKVLKAAQDAKVERFVQIGAAAVVMGNKAVSYYDESYPLQQPKYSPYIATKSLAEKKVLDANRPDFCTSVVRPSWIWGVGDHALPQIAKLALQKRFVWIETGNYEYMTTHVSNVCHGAILAAQRGSGGQAYFVGDGDVVNFRDWITRLLAVLKVEPGHLSLPRPLSWGLATAAEACWTGLRLSGAPPVTRTMLRLIGQELTFSDIKARQELGYQPIVTREQGLLELVEYYGSVGLPYGQ